CWVFNLRILSCFPSFRIYRETLSRFVRRFIRSLTLLLILIVVSLLDTVSGRLRRRVVEE
ncbi:hypothetical protein WDV93_11470, partial [Pantoea ananatis]